MTTPITKEQRIEEVETLIDNAEEWASFYEHPIHDKPHRDMFEGMARVMREYLAALKDAEPVADVVAWHKEGEERTCDIRWRRFDVAPGPLFAVAQTVVKVPDALPENDDEDGNDIDYMEPTEVYALGRRDGWNACRAAMLNHSENERDMVEPVSQPYKLPSQSSDAVNEAAWKLHDTLTEHGPLNGHQFNNLKGCFYEALKVAMCNSPVIPEGWQLVPVEPTKEMIDAGWLHFMGTKNPSSKGTYKAMLAAAPQQEVKP